MRQGSLGIFLFALKAILLSKSFIFSPENRVSSGLTSEELADSLTLVTEGVIHLQ